MTDFQRLEDALAALNAAVRAMPKFASTPEQWDALQELWHDVRLILASATVEHHRLMEADVSDAEAALRRAGSNPWRDLLDSSSDGETVENDPPACADVDHLPLVVLSFTATVYRPRLPARIADFMRKGVK